MEIQDLSFRKTNYRQNSYIFFGIFTVLFFTYLPIIQGYYLFGEDYHIVNMVNGKCDSFYGYNFLINQTNRPLLLYSFCAYSYILNTISDANFIRSISVLIQSGSAFVLYLCFRHSKINIVHSVLLAVIIVVLPAFQTSMVIVSGQPLIVSALLSILAGFFALRWVNIEKEGRSHLFNRYSVIAFILLFISLLIYQSNTMLFWVVVTAFLVGIDITEWNKYKNKIFKLFGLGFVAIFVYFLYAKTNYYFYGSNDPDQMRHAIELNIDILPRLEAFIKVPLFDALNLWNIWPTKEFAGFMLLLISIGILISVIKIKKAGRIDSRYYSAYIQKIIFVITLLFLSFLPSLAAANQLYFPYRTQIALTPFIIIILYWSLSKIVLVINRNEMVITALLLLACLISIGKAHYHISNYYVLPQTLELRYMKSALLQNDLSKFKKIHIIRINTSQISSIVAPKSRKDEFGKIMGINNYTVMIMFKAMLPDLPARKRSEVEKYFKEGKISISSKDDLRKLEFNEPTLFIDLTRLRHFY